MMLVAASLLLFLVGLIHSILGEVLIFKKLRLDGIVPNTPLPPLQVRNLRILWATWHLATALGWGMSAILLLLANTVDNEAMIVTIIAYSSLASGMLVLYATKAKHPGWVGLMGVAILCWLA